MHHSLGDCVFLLRQINWPAVMQSKVNSDRVYEAKNSEWQRLCVGIPQKLPQSGVLLQAEVQEIQ